jgi:enoyl-CoA hydratase/carnithine racemase
MGMISVDMCGDIAVLELDNGVTNAIDAELAAHLSEALKDAKAAARGVVLCGNEKFFSMGFYLPGLIELDRDGMREFLFGFNRAIHDLFVLPMPTAVAIEGHAIAGGTILGLAADFRIVTAGKRLMGLNEIKLGLPVPYLALLILSQKVGHGAALDIIYHGEFVNAEKAFDLGLVDELVAPGSARERAVERIKTIAGYPSGAFQLMKETQVASIKAKYAEHHAEQHERFLDCWFGKETQVLLKEAAAKF